MLEKFKEGTQVKLPIWLSGLQRPGGSRTLADYFINADGDLYIGVQTERGLVYVNAENLRLEVIHSACPSCRCVKSPRQPRRVRVPIESVELDDDELEDEEPEDDEEED